MLWVIFLFIAAGLTLTLLGLWEFRRTKTAHLKLPQQEPKAKKASALSYILGIFPFTQALLKKLGLEQKIRDRLDAAHLKLSVQEFFNLKVIIILLLVGFSFLVFNKIDFLILVITLAMGYVLPDFWLSRKIAQRKSRVARLLPETVDLLGLCVEAGLDFTTAMKWVIDKVPVNPILEELAFVLEEIRWGKPRTQALKDMARRLNVTEVNSFVQTLVQAERMGTPVAEAFSILSEDTRLQRFHRGERIAMQAPIKILIPLIFCILPVIAIVVGGPVILQFTQGDYLKTMGL